MRETEPDRMIDMLYAVRSLRRAVVSGMSLLSKALSEPELVDLYSGLLASEARHHMLYVDLACTVADRDFSQKASKNHILT